MTRVAPTIYCKPHWGKIFLEILKTIRRARKCEASQTTTLWQATENVEHIIDRELAQAVLEITFMTPEHRVF